MNRRNQILSAVLAVQIVLAIVVFWPGASVSGAEAGPLLPEFSVDAVTSLTIKDAEGNHVTLAKISDGWVLPEADDYPADAEKVSSLLDKIGKLKTDRQVTQTEASHKRLQVAEDDFVRLVELKLADGQTHKLYLGSSPRSSATHVRADNRPETYLAADLPSYDVNARAATWIDTLYYTVPQTSTTTLTLKNANGQFEFERDEENKWTLKGLAEGEQFRQSTFDTLLGQATSLRLVEPIGREEQEWFKLDEPQAEVVVQTDDGQTFILRIGAKGEENSNYVAKWSGTDYYVWVAQYTGDSFINKTRQDFIEPPPTPAPAEGVEPTEAPSGGN